MTHTYTSRRAVLGSIGAVGTFGLAGCLGGGNGNDGGSGGNGGGSGGNGSGGSSSGGGSGSGGNASGTLRIGVLQPLSGDLQYYGQQALWGFYSGLAHKADTNPPTGTSGTKRVSVGDVTYELLVRDTQFSSDTAQTVATDLVQNGNVDMLFGCASSGAAERVINTVVKPSGVPMMVGPAASASITSESATCGENVFRASENTAMDARSGGRYVAQQTDVSKVYLFGADYSFGRAVVSNYENVLEQNGVEIVGTKFVPQGYSEWQGLLDNAQSAGAEGVVGGFTVATLPSFFTSILQGGYDFQVFGGFATQITTQIVGQTLGKVLGTPLTEGKLSESNLGPFTSRYHWNQYDNEINNAFVESYTNAYGVVPDLFTSGTFTAASAIVQAVTESGSTDGAEIASALQGMTVHETPKGQDAYVFQGYDNQARSPMTIANLAPNDVADWDAPIKPSAPVATIPADRTTIPQDGPEMSCSL